MSVNPFLFTRSFDSERHGTVASDAAEIDAPDAIVTDEPAPPPLRHTDEDLERVREEAYAAGRTEAEAAATNAASGATEARLAAALEAIAERLGDAAIATSSLETVWSAAAARVATSVVQKMMPGLRRRFAADDVLQVFEAVFANGAEPTSLTVVVSADLHDVIADRLGATAERTGFAGRLTVVADPDIAEGDCRITWPGGGAVRDQSALWASIETALAALTCEATADAPAPTPIASAA